MHTPLSLIDKKIKNISQSKFIFQHKSVGNTHDIYNFVLPNISIYIAINKTFKTLQRTL